MKKASSILSLALIAGFSQSANAADAQTLQANKGEVLVLLSSENMMQLADGKTAPTGYYLNEFGVPAKALTDAGYKLVLATPKGNAPSVDKKSVIPQYFDGGEAHMQAIQTFVASLEGINDTLSLTEVIAQGLDEFEGVFVPGGHAPLIDLANNPQVGLILSHFHNEGKPTAAICHGPIALLSGQSNPEAFELALKSGEQATSEGWIYEGYKMTIFSTPEEEYFESTLDDATLLYYPADAMAQAGGKMEYKEMWAPNVVEDRELITGQNPFSDELLAETLLAQLNSKFN
ncbi:type 1 glutamine amidotransferase domain-containing protein [Alteromonas sp. KUL106]|uniref:type 1 glutamine amidotransferase domain-containing protein n=1 Tax=Alteromonas sp. KUL106 TaxID=2480799 RepID=UPI0012E51D46|nr:type 1 glutamine amidotransferase domain-containing protein [Alteromonas sp. KUL106]GFD67782.1 type 1 glutamine amidotransferase domain-containing protein [Alteromonas sp. KUL106]